MTPKPIIALICLSVVCLLPHPVVSHGRLWEPPGRSTMWRRGFQNPENYRDNELFCGGFQHELSLGYKCGVCGDPFDAPEPKPNEAGGKYANGIITRTYKQGQSANFSAELTANHLGTFEFKICPTNDHTVKATQECFDAHPVPMADGSGNRYKVGSQKGYVTTHVVLPDDLICDFCVLQWRYHTANSWGTDENGRSCTGCGPQEEFYGCSDIRIISKNGQTSNPITTQPTTQNPTTTPKPITLQTTTQKPTTRQPTIQNPTNLLPITKKPTTQKTSTPQITPQTLTTLRPTSQKLTTQKPLTQNPITPNPTQKQAILQMSTQKLTTQQLSSKNPIAVQSTTQITIPQPTTKKPTGQQSTSPKLTTQQSTTQQPTTPQSTKQSSTKTPTTRQHTTQRPTTKQPTTQTLHSTVRPTTKRPEPHTHAPHKVCHGTHENHGFDDWCKDNCKVGNCPSSVCVCGVLTAQDLHAKDCHPIGVYASMGHYANWCNVNCRRGYCPNNMCRCR